MGEVCNSMSGLGNGDEEKFVLIFYQTGTRGPENVMRQKLHMCRGQHRKSIRDKTMEKQHTGQKCARNTLHWRESDGHLSHSTAQE